MPWAETLQKIADAAPLLGKLLPIPGAGVAGDLIAAAFGTKNDRASIEAAIAADPQAAMKLREIEENNRTLLEQQLILAENTRLETVNQTMRAEAASNDPYVRRWRPTWGYATAAAWTVQVFGCTAAVLWVSFQDPARAGIVFDGIAAIISAGTVSWGIALSVLGINVQQRSRDKAVAAGKTPAPGIVSSLVSKITGAAAAPDRDRK